MCGTMAKMTVEVESGGGVEGLGLRPQGSPGVRPKISPLDIFRTHDRRTIECKCRGI